MANPIRSSSTKSSDSSSPASGGPDRQSKVREYNPGGMKGARYGAQASIKALHIKTCKGPLHVISIVVVGGLIQLQASNTTPSKHSDLLLARTLCQVLASAVKTTCAGSKSLHRYHSWDASGASSCVTSLAFFRSRLLWFRLPGFPFWRGRRLCFRSGATSGFASPYQKSRLLQHAIVECYTCRHEC